MEMENYKLFPKDTSQSAVTVSSTLCPAPQLEWMPQKIENPPYYIFKKVPKCNIERQSQKRDAVGVPEEIPCVAPNPNQNHPENSKYQVLTDVIGKKTREIRDLCKIKESEHKNNRMKTSYLNKQNSTFSANVDKLAAKTEELTKKMREVQAELDQRDVDLATKTKEALEHRQQYDLTSSQLKTVLGQLTTKNQELVARFNSKCAELDELHGLFKEKCFDCDTLFKKHKKMERLLNKKNCEINCLNRNIEDLNHQLSFENTCCAVFEEKIQKLELQITIEKEFNKGLQEKLSLLRAETIYQDISPKTEKRKDKEIAKKKCESASVLRTALEWKTGQLDTCTVTSSSSSSPPSNGDNKKTMVRKRKLIIIPKSGKEEYKKERINYPEMTTHPVIDLITLSD